MPLYNPPAAAGISFKTVVTPPAIAANQNDYNPTGLATANILNLTLAASGTYNITGIAAQPPGTTILLANTSISSGFTISLLPENSGSTGANRFAATPAGGTFSLFAGDAVLIVYDGVLSRWRIVTGTF